MIPNAYPPWILNAKTKEAQYDKCCQNLSKFLLKDTFHSSSCFGLLTFLACRFQHEPDHNWENWSLQTLIIILLLIVMSLWAHKAEMYIIHYKPVVRQLCVFTSADRCAQSTSSTQSLEDESARVLFFSWDLFIKKMWSFCVYQLTMFQMNQTHQIHTGFSAALKGYLETAQDQHVTQKMFSINQPSKDYLHLYPHFA